ncbi:MAG: hypothetical protein Q7T57_02495 [Dehalococcoidales bacterium]|nr:hypothetical protein [Dehalococcoidales bacterium]
MDAEEEEEEAALGFAFEADRGTDKTAADTERTGLRVVVFEAGEEEATSESEGDAAATTEAAEE